MWQVCWAVMAAYQATFQICSLPLYGLVAAEDYARQPHTFYNLYLYPQDVRPPQIIRVEPR